jgi:hypothetical protein
MNIDNKISMSRKKPVTEEEIKNFLKREYGDRGGINDREEARKALKENGASKELIWLVLGDY